MDTQSQKLLDDITKRTFMIIDTSERNVLHSQGLSRNVSYLSTLVPTLIPAEGDFQSERT